MKKILWGVLFFLCLILLTTLSELVLFKLATLIDKSSGFWFWSIMIFIFICFYSTIDYIASLIMLFATYIGPYTKFNMNLIIFFSLIHLIYNIFNLIGNHLSIGFTIAGILLWTFINTVFAFKAYLFKTYKL